MTPEDKDRPEEDQIDDSPTGDFEILGGDLSSDERTWGMIVHLSALSGYVLGGLAGFVAPLAIWLVKKEESKFLDDQGREALNFQLTILVGILISIPLCFIIIGFVTLLGLVIADIAYTILAGMKANEGVWYRYPWTIKFFPRGAAPGA